MAFHSVHVTRALKIYETVLGPDYPTSKIIKKIFFKNLSLFA